MKPENSNLSTLKTTRTQGQVMALLTEALRIDAGCSMETHVYLCEVDMRMHSSDVFQPGDTPSIDEIDCKSGTSEVLTVAISARSYMYGVDWNNPITGSVEAKLRLFRERKHAPWRLHYIMLILPNLFGGKKPSMYVVREFSSSDHLDQLLKDPGKFFKEYATGEANDRSGNAHDLLRLSQLMLNDQVVPWEVLHPKAVVQAPTEKIAEPGWFRNLIKRLLRKK